MEASEATSAINAPHSDDPNPDDFFGDGAAEQPAATTEAAPPAAAPSALDPVDEEPTPPAAEPEQPAAPADPPAPADTPEASGTPSRIYVVLREVKLTPEILKALLEEAEKGDEGAYRLAHFELDKVEARNVKGALAETFNKHSERLGQKLRLTPIPERTWATKTIEPQQRTVSSLNIT